MLPKSRLYNSYGCTESTACCMLEYSNRPDDGTCVGTPCETALIHILDPTMGSELEHGAGRVAIGGGGVMSGYWGDEEATSATLVDGLVRTNDLGEFRDGDLHILGRIDDVAIVGGINVSPIEVEEVAAMCPGVVDCACIKVADKVTGDKLALFVVWDTAASVVSSREETLVAFLRGRMESSKVPAEVLAIAEVPRTYNGKVDRRLLAELFADGDDGRSRA